MIVAVLAPVSRLICGVVQAVVEQPDDGPALGHVAELVQRAEVAQEAGGLVAVLQADDRVDQRFRVGGSPVFGHRWVLVASLVAVVAAC